MNSQPEYRVGIGASSIIMIFIVLCLTTLGVLSFASARANLVLTERRQEKVEAFYQTDAKAQALIAAIDSALLKAAQQPAEEFEAHVKALSNIDASIQVKGGSRAQFSLPVGDTQTLEVELAIQEPGSAQRYSISKYQLMYTGEWAPDNSIVLMTELMEENP